MTHTRTLGGLLTTGVLSMLLLCNGGRPAYCSTFHAEGRALSTGTGDSLREAEAQYGYGAAKPLSKAVDEFNGRARKDKIGKKQPPLTAREVIAAIRCWNRDADPMSDSAYHVFQSIAESKVMPRGSYVRFIPGVVALNGYDTDVWWIDLIVGLDKYPTTLADVPMYHRRIRTTYVESRRH